MLLLRFLGVFALILIAAGVIAWMVTGDVRYRDFAFKVSKGGLILVFVFLAMLFLERALAPMV
jgi:hypothetical protein